MNPVMRRIRAGAVWVCGAGVSMAAQAHAGGTGVLSAWLHPLTGADHLAAMIAVGAWSVQLGGRAVWGVPVAFLSFMLVGGVVGFQLIDLAGVEFGVALSVLLLGLAIALDRRTATIPAAAAVGAFGFCHGYLHGYELTVLEQPVWATLGFLTTTAMLHVAGLVAGHFALRSSAGQRLLRGCGWLVAVFGCWLLASRALG
jgi:urease accessory protein